MNATNSAQHARSPSLAVLVKDNQEARDALSDATRTVRETCHYIDAVVREGRVPNLVELDEHYVRLKAAVRVWVETERELVDAHLGGVR